MPNFVIANKIEVANPHANLDVLYGPYQDLLEAKSSVLPVLREKGLTVGVYESGAVVEYWWKAGTTDAHLVLKQAGATIDLNAIDTQLNTATEAETATDTTVLYVIGKAKITALKLYNYIKAKLDLVYAAINHNHTLASLSEKSYNNLSDKPTIPAAQVNADWNATEGVAEILNKPTIPTIPELAEVATSGSYDDLSDKPSIPSIAGLMKEVDYTGETGTKQVNYAKSADEAELSIHSYSAQQDALGREIHTTYALKQSGITPPETTRVILDNQTPTYTIAALTAENLIVENNATAGGKIIAPVLAADKTLKITIQGNDTLLNGNTYEDGVTIFAIYEASTETWTFNSILDPEVPNYSDMTVDVMLENPTVLTSIRNGILVAQFIHVSKTVFIRTHSTAIGIYQCRAIYSGNAYLEPIAAGTALHTVRVKDGDVWYSQYDGKNLSSLIFEKLGDVDTSALVPKLGIEYVSLGFTMNHTTRLFTINDAHTVYINGKAFAKTSSSVTIANTAGTHYIYYNADGVLVSNMVGFAGVQVGIVVRSTTSVFTNYVQNPAYRNISYNGEFAQETIKLQATAAAQTVTLKKSTVCTIVDSNDSFAIGNIVGDTARNITIALPPPDSQAFNQYVVYLKIGIGQMPTVILPTVNECLGGAIIFSTGTTFKMVFDRIKTGTSTYTTTMSWAKTQ